jgi:hypothetical protein
MTDKPEYAFGGSDVTFISTAAMLIFLQLILIFFYLKNRHLYPIKGRFALFACFCTLVGIMQVCVMSLSWVNIFMRYYLSCGMYHILIIPPPICLTIIIGWRTFFCYILFESELEKIHYTEYDQQPLSDMVPLPSMFYLKLKRWLLNRKILLILLIISILLIFVLYVIWAIFVVPESFSISFVDFAGCSKVAYKFNYLAYGIVFILILWFSFWAYAMRKYKEGLYIAAENRIVLILLILVVVIMAFNTNEQIQQSSLEIFPWMPFSIMFIIALAVLTVSGLPVCLQLYYRRSLAIISSTGKRDLRKGMRKCLRNPVALKDFTNLLKSEWSLENLLFIQSVDIYKKDIKLYEKSQSEEEMRVAFLKIWDTFLDSQCLLQVNLPATIIDPLKNILRNGPYTVSIFDDAYNSVFVLLAEDSFHRFLMMHGTLTLEGLSTVSESDESYSIV